MLFSQILDIHRSATAEHSHSEILGDAFLLNENPMYRNMRLRALEIGVSFTEATTQYLLMPFKQLDQITTSKQVPFVPHARLMAEVESAHPATFDLEQMPMPESYHLHESAHVIADSCCSDIDARAQEDKILKAILCESFANTVDAMTCAYANSEIHRVFIKLNCYMAPSDTVRDQMRTVRQTLGEKFAARLVLLSYVFANFFKEVPMELIAHPEASEQVLKECVALSGIGEELDPLFRVQTTSNYFHLQGFRGEIFDLLDFDFAARLQRADFNKAFEAMVCLAT